MRYITLITLLLTTIPITLLADSNYTTTPYTSSLNTTSTIKGKGYYKVVRVKAYSPMEDKYILKYSNNKGLTRFYTDVYTVGIAADNYYYPYGTKIGIRYKDRFGKVRMRTLTVDDSLPQVKRNRNLLYIRLLTATSVKEWNNKLYIVFIYPHANRR